MESSERDEGQNDDASKDRDQSTSQPTNDTSPQAPDGDIANASASDADAGDLSGSESEE